MNHRIGRLCELLYFCRKKIMKMACCYFFMAALLLLCLAPMPYGYYQLVRFVAMVAFAVMAWNYYEKKQEGWAIVFGALALLFQPFAAAQDGRMLHGRRDDSPALSAAALPDALEHGVVALGAA